MIRNKILSILASIKPLDEIENEHLSIVKDLVSSKKDIFRPKALDLHLVSYFVLIDEKKKKVLLVDHKKGALWLPTGGHVEDNEHPYDTVVREAKEELNISAIFMLDDPLFLTICNTTITPKNPVSHKDISFWYVLKGDSDLIYEYDEKEFHSIFWFDFDKVPFEKADPNMRRFLEKMQKKLL